MSPQSRADEFRGTYLDLIISPHFDHNFANVLTTLHKAESLLYLTYAIEIDRMRWVELALLHGSKN